MPKTFEKMVKIFFKSALYLELSEFFFIIIKCKVNMSYLSDCVEICRNQTCMLFVLKKNTFLAVFGQFLWYFFVVLFAIYNGVLLDL